MQTTWKPEKDIPFRSRYANLETHWCGSDSEKVYQVRGNKAYKPTDVTYKFNSLGYRSVEFDTSGPKLLSVGCSTVFGTGLPQSEMFTEIVASRLGLSNFNLGLSGASNDYITRMLRIAISKFNPEFVIVQFTYASRRWFVTPSGEEFFYHPYMVDRSNRTVEVRECSKHLQSLGNPNEDVKNLYNNFLLASHLLAGRKWLFSCVNNNFSFLQGFFDQQKYVGEIRFDIDKARDGLHPGREANHDLACRFLDRFSEC